METVTTTTTMTQPTPRVYLTTESQRRADAKWKNANRESYNAHKREAFKLKYHSDEEFRLKKIAINTAWYYTIKERKQTAAAAAEAAAATAAAAVCFFSFCM